MSLRDYLQILEGRKRLHRVYEPISKHRQIASLLSQLEPQALFLENVLETRFRVMGNLFCSKQSFAEYLGITVPEIIPTLNRAIQQRTPPQVVSHAPCQDIIELDPDLDTLPILRHLETDGGNYISSGIMISKHPTYGQNVDFHRCMQFSKTEMAVRVVKGRHFDRFLEDQGAVDVAICIGNPPHVLAAAATSVELGVNEMEIANAMQPVRVVKAHTVDLLIPADTEFVIEGTIYRDRRHPEGPFLDLTETQDVIRNEPVMVVKAITHRNDAIWHALLPGALEHKLLMGMPREPTIYREVNKVVKCLDVTLSPGGCSWLHAIVQIDKQHKDDGMRALEAAFKGHRSCKHIYVVDKDIDIYDSQAVEWAMATRFQGDRDLMILPREPGSSLDPSSDPGTHDTTRVGFDLTKPLYAKGKNFEKIPYPPIDPKRFNL